MSKKDQLKSTAADNLARARNLVAIYETHLLGTGKGRRPVSSSDILRAAVVFLHASLEDFLRNLAEWKIPQADAAVLNKIPLVGQSNGRAEKFYLGELSSHRSKTIDQLFKESVSAYLEKSNYNNIGELKTLLKDVGIDPNSVSSTYSDLAKVMSRRHHIVHRVDRNDTPGRGHHRAKPINHGKVKSMIHTVEKFIDDVLQQI
jgi:hypothetical protein